MSSQPIQQWQALRTAAAARWQAMQPRERWMVAIAAAIVLGALVWRVAIAPAWQTWQSYDGARTALDRQVQQMQTLRQQALQMQQEIANRGATASSGASATALHAELLASAQRLLGNSAQATLVGDRVTVRFQAAPAAALAEWLEHSRSRTRSQVVQLEANRSTGGNTAGNNAAASAANNPASALWSGQVVLALPLAEAR